MREIAKKMGVSHVTVSLALSDNPRISHARRDAIKKTAEAMGYRPDPALTALVHYRHSRMGENKAHSVIAWLNFWPRPAMLRSLREFDGYWTGAQEVAALYGYRLEEFVINTELPLKRLETVLRSRSVPGILLPPAPVAGMLKTEDFPWGEFAVVAFGQSHASLPIHMVTSDQYAAGKLAFRSIVDRGYRRIGFTGFSDRLNYTRFFPGYIQEQFCMPKSDRIPPLFLENKKSHNPLEELRVWIARHKPDAIISEISELYSWLNEIGVHTPQQIGLATTTVLDGHADSGIYQNSEEIGRAAAETVISQINQHHLGIPQVKRLILIEGVWRDGKTLPVRQPERT